MTELELNTKKNLDLGEANKGQLKHCNLKLYK